VTEREFCFWLRGYIYDREIKTLDEKQLKTVKTHLARLTGAPKTEKVQKPAEPKYQVYK